MMCQVLGRGRISALGAMLGLAMVVAGPATGQVWRADELVVPEEGVYSVSEENHIIEVQRWVMGDGAVMELDADVPRLEIRAQEVVIGRDVVIRASGLEGEDGNMGTTSGAGVALCSAGRAGGPGEDGGGGGGGKDVDIVMGVVNIAGLFIDVSGGRGGDGGGGGVGQRGARGSCQMTLGHCGCNGGRGGRGGSGGNAGQGGGAGSVSIRYWPLGDDTSIAVIPNVQGGEPGVAGLPGEGGRGGPRFRCENICYLFGTTKRGGSRGASGEGGGTGERGVDGAFALRVVAPVGLAGGGNGGR